RFAPSPTGRLHVGNVRTALINWLFAKSAGGEFVLRIDDTDTERSTPAFEDGIREDLTWLGLRWADSFKQSDRFATYDAAAETLKSAGLLYACYETPEELERKRKLSLARGKPPVYDRSALSLTSGEKAALEAEGRKPHWRFKLSGGACAWTDLVRGDQSIDTSSISDPVLIRADGTYLYTLPSVVDDIDAKITHVVRGEDHVTNSGAQIEIFKALGGEAPQMAHTPLLIGADGQGLSKRLGSLSIAQLRDEDYEPMAISSLLAKIGTSDAVEARRDLETLASEFEFAKIGRAPARFDEKDLTNLNAELVHASSFTDVEARVSAYTLGGRADETFWTAISGNLTRVSDAAEWLMIIYGDVTTTVDPEDAEYIVTAANALPNGDVTDATWGEWTSALKAATGRKGKALFMPLRLALTGKSQGPSMDKVLSLLGRDKALTRLSSATSA
ncbi:MAG: glutamate--tRNA ligase, partial [Pseudomonadota bacterium]